MYELTQLFWYRPLFMAELIAAEALFVVRLNRKSRFPLRLLAAILFCFGVAFAFPVAAYNAIYCSFMFLSMFIATVVMLKFLFNETLSNLIYCAIAGYTTQHLAYQLYDLFIVVSGINGGLPLNSYGSGSFSLGQNAFQIIVSLYIYGISYWLIYLFFASKIKKFDVLQLKKPSILVLVIMIVLIDIIFSAVITYSNSDPENYNITHIIMLYIYNIACCLLAFYILFELPLRKKVEQEFNTINQLWHLEKEQYSLAKENIDLINLKCHDLRHQIRMIGTQGPLGQKTIDEIEKIVSIYDSVVKTGNNALDVILTEKSLLCNKNGIRFSCIADGLCLNFMKETDLYSLFGNMIDNAVEAVSALEADERIIGLTVKKVQSLLSINIHNYYNGELRFEKNLPLTTKEDKEFHGFGMKSIKLIIDKYSGEMSISANNRIFNLNIVFPS